MLNGDEIAQILSRHLQKRIVYKPVNDDEFKHLDAPGEEDVNMFAFIREFNDDYVKRRNLKECQKLYPKIMSFDTWVEQNKERIPIKDVKSMVFDSK